jgi:hypothetical protein
MVPDDIRLRVSAGDHHREQSANSNKENSRCGFTSGFAERNSAGNQAGPERVARRPDNPAVLLLEDIKV